MWSLFTQRRDLAMNWDLAMKTRNIALYQLSRYDCIQIQQSKPTIVFAGLAALRFDD